MTDTTLAAWSLDARTEPMVRIGVALPSDGMHSVRLTIPAQQYRLTAGTQSTSLRSTDIEIVVEDARVRLRSEHADLPAAAVITLAPTGDAPLARGSGVRAHGLLTGRGFHWQKRFNPTLPGTLEFRACGERLLLVNVLPLEMYLAGVIAGEMSGACPLEFLKSQCVVARAWVLAHTENKHSEIPIDRCNDDCCQRYHGTTDVTDTVLAAVRGTRGQVIVDREMHIIDANYSKSCGGIIEAPEHVWGLAKPGQRAALDAPRGSEAHRFFPLLDDQLDEFLTGAWLQSTDIFCSPTVVPEQDLPRYLGKVDEGGGHFRWQVSYERAELEEILRCKLFSRAEMQELPALGTLTDIRVLKRGHSGRASLLEVAYLDGDGNAQRARVQTEYNIRDALHERFLFSSAFKVHTERDASAAAQRFTLVGAGWGHGAGLCQIGALGMAVKGYTCEQIVTHYFEGVRLHACY